MPTCLQFYKAIRHRPRASNNKDSGNIQQLLPRRLSNIKMTETVQFMEEAWFKVLATILSNILLFFLVFGMSATVKIG
jgi:hypothetical protein